MEGKSRTAIYFTQGHGELDINDRDTSANRGLGQLRSLLEKGNNEVKELQFGGGVDRIPDDAAVVVIARPTMPFSEAELKVLRDYMNASQEGKKKGKLVVLLDVVLDREGNMAGTGLEGLLAEFQVQVGNNRILNASPQFSPTTVLAVANPRSQNPIAKAFVQGEVALPFLLDDVRTVQPSSEMPDRPNRYMVESIMMTLSPQLPMWAETNIRGDPVEIVKDLRRPERRQDLIARMSKTPLSVAVAVSESPANPHDFTRPEAPSGPQPRLVVFGDATWVTNRVLMDERKGGRINYDLFASTLSWLRDRPDIGIQADDKVRTVYVLKAPPEVVGRLYVLPMLLTLIGIATLGACIWVVRQR